MELFLNEEDLLKKFRGLSCHEVRFEHFKPSVQDAILWSGRKAVYEGYETNGGSNRCLVRFPKKCPGRWM